MDDKDDKPNDSGRLRMYDTLKKGGFKGRQAFQILEYIEKRIEEMNPTDAINRLSAEQSATGATLKSALESLNVKLAAQDVKLAAQKNRFDSQYRVLQWMIGTLIALFAAFTAASFLP